MKVALKIIFIAFFFILGLILKSNAQSVPLGFQYQTLVRNAAGVEILNQQVAFRISIFKNSVAGILVWQEDQLCTTDGFGKAAFVIGTGVNTGSGTLSSFSQIDWAADRYYFKIGIDITGGNSFLDMGQTQLFSVPFSFFSDKTQQSTAIIMNDLTDVNLAALSPNKLLRWTGINWVVSNDIDSDTAAYSVYSLNSLASDTSLYTFGSTSSDTILFAYDADTVSYSSTTVNSLTSYSSNNSDTANYAMSSPPFAWQLSGSAIGASNSFLGVTDNIDYSIRTNNVSRLTFDTSGRLKIGNNTNNAKFSVSGNDGVVIEGTFGTMQPFVAGPGTKLLWYPSSGSIRSGGVSNNLWDTINIKDYSAAFGFNANARKCSFSSGYGTIALDYSIAMGRVAQSNGVGPYPRGNTIALGDSCLSLATRSVTIGKDNVADSTVAFNGSTAVLIGYKNRTIGVVSTCLGSYNYAGNTRCVAIGYHAYSVNNGSFVYADASTSTNANSSANFQFLVRASGGTVFYTDSANSMGVTLASGSGSWSVISDRNMKENFNSVDHEEILNKIARIKVMEWNYKSQDKSIRHIGPMSQDIHKYFTFGESKKTISTVDMDGIIISGIKAIDSRIIQLNEELKIDELENRFEKINNTDSLNKRLDLIEKEIERIKK